MACWLWGSPQGRLRTLILVPFIVSTWASPIPQNSFPDSYVEGKALGAEGTGRPKVSISHMYCLLIPFWRYDTHTLTCASVYRPQIFWFSLQLERGLSSLSLSPTSRSTWWCQYVSFSGILLYTVSPQHINIQVLNFQRCELVFQQSQEGVTLKLALQLLLLMILQFHHLPPPLPPPVSNSSCLFTWHQPLDTSCCSSLLYFSKYYTVRLKIYERDIPGGSSSKEYTCQCKGHRFETWSKRIPLEVR